MAYGAAHKVTATFVKRVLPVQLYFFLFLLQIYLFLEYFHKGILNASKFD